VHIINIHHFHSSELTPIIIYFKEKSIFKGFAHNPSSK